MTSKERKTVVVFGVFDRLHKGHLHLLRTAARLGRVVVILARDRTVFSLKRHWPLQKERTRALHLRRTGIPATVALGDLEQGSYATLRRYKPQIIVLGYDQKELMKDIRKRIKKGDLPVLDLIQAKGHRPSELHSSLLRSVRRKPGAISPR